MSVEGNRRNGPLNTEADRAPKTHEQPSQPHLGVEALRALIIKSLEDDKAEDVVVIDLKDKTSVTDAMVIASGRSQRHVGAIADHLMRAIKDAGLGRVGVEGLPACDWVLIDAGDVVVHLFRPEVRDYYNLEKMWGGDAVEATRSAHVS
ncbi:MAG: ribosome silencing factor [Maricaulaceae bacterium]|jgi:ribosome-associated protein